MKFDDIKKLHQKKYRHESGHFLVEGEHLVQELEKAALQNPALKNSRIFATQDYQNWPTHLDKVMVTEKQMSQLSETKSPQGIVAVVPTAALSVTSSTAPAQENQRAVYLYEIQDPGNLGTLLRTLAWFGGFRCLLSPNSVDLFNAKVIRASMGAIFHVPIELDVPIESLSRRFHHMACLEVGGEPVASANFKRHDCLVFGNEARGLSSPQKMSLPMTAFGIPGTAAIESLNLATAVSLCVYEVTRS